MSSVKGEDLSKRYDYRIDVVDNGRNLTYFTDNIDLSKSAFVTFAPRCRLSRDKVEEVNGQILTFPSHLVKKVTNYVRT